MANKQQNIPDGWEVKKLKDLSVNNIFNGIFNDPKKVGTGYKLINVIDLYSDKILLDSLKRLSVDEKDLNKYTVVQGDLLFTRSSLKAEGIAHCNLVYDYSEVVVFDCHIMRLRPNKQIVNPYYLFRYCQTKKARDNFIKNSKTTTMTTIDQNGLGTIDILLPPLPEQERIAEVLGCFDEGIEKLGSVIKLKEKQKKGLMQKLLSGKTRLKGFTEPWKKVKLGETGEIITGNTPPMKDNDNYGNEYLWVTAEDFKDRYIIDSKIKLSNKGVKLARIVPAGSILVTCIASIGLNAIAKLALATNQQINSIIPKKEYCSEFIYYLIGFNKNTLISHAGAGGILMLSKGSFQNIKLNFPSDVAEQSAIADILSAADREIELLKQKLELFKQQKQYLMQQLLTGKIRVKLN